MVKQVIFVEWKENEKLHRDILKSADNDGFFVVGKNSKVTWNMNPVLYKDGEKVYDPNEYSNSNKN